MNAYSTDAFRKPPNAGEIAGGERTGLASGTQRRSGLTRRHFLMTGLSALAAPLVSGCTSSPTTPDDSDSDIRTSRLTARPGIPTETPTLGLSQLDVEGGSSGALYVPQGYSPETPAPLFIGLHGAGGSSSNWVAYHDIAEARGMVFVAPDSIAHTWDLMTFPNYVLGPDVVALDRVLRYIFARCRIDPTHIALGGFSDGASYSISLGIGNGDLFSHLVAYSPGFYDVPDPVVGSPPIFISHGTQDEVLPFIDTAEHIVTSLRDLGYDVTFQQFEGGHEVPAEVAEASLDWFLPDND